MSGSCSGYSNRTVRRLGLVSATATPDFCSAPSTAARTAPTVSPDCGGRGWRSSRTTSATERGKSPARRGPERCLARTSGTADCCRAHPPIIRTGSRNRTNVALIRMQLVRTPGRPEQADNRLMLPVLRTAKDPKTIPRSRQAVAREMGATTSFCTTRAAGRSWKRIRPAWPTIGCHTVRRCAGNVR